MKNPRCRNCGEKNSSFFLNKSNYNYYKCSSCQMVFLDYAKDYHKLVSQFYDKTYFTGDPNITSYDNYEEYKSLAHKNLGGFINQISNLIPKRGKHLDVGCAFGYSLLLTEKLGFEPWGVEISKYAAKKAQKKFGRKIKNCSFEKVKFPNRFFNLITLLNVLEHLECPSKAINKASKLLKPKGILVIWTNDRDSLFARLMRKSWYFYSPPEHLFIPNTKSILSMLSKNGLSAKIILKKGKWFSLGYLFHLARTIQKSKLADICYKIVKNTRLRSFPIYLRFNDSIIIYAKKTHST